MRVRAFKEAGHVPSLVAALAHFEASFACWVLLGVLSIPISEELRLGPAAKGIAVGLPLVAGSVFRLVVGPLSDRWGPRLVGVVTLSLTIVPLSWGWLGARSFPEILGLGAMLGVAGASFAVALPLAGRAFPGPYRGLAMGIAGAGNSGTVVAALAAPGLVAAFGWHGVMGTALVPVVCALAAFVLLTRRTPGAQRSDREPVLAVARHVDARSLAGLYLVTFGGFVGMISFLPLMLRDVYGMSILQAGRATALCALAGSTLRPVGGYLADRMSGERVLPTVYAVAATALVGLAGRPSSAGAIALSAVTVGAFGIGNGAVFQIVPRRFPRSIGAVTGFVGAAGGLGGFLLPALLGIVRERTGSYGGGLAAVAAGCLLVAATLAPASRRWRTLAAGVPQA